MKTLSAVMFAIALAVMPLFSSRANEDFSKETIKATPLTPSMYMLEGAGGNMTALLGSDGVFLVDDDFAEMAEKLSAKLSEIKGGNPRYIVNTHFHYDHTGGNSVFGSSAIIFSTSEVRERLMHEQTLWHKQHPPMPPQAWPSVTYKTSLSLHIDGDEIELIHLPHGHTDGDTVVYFEKNKVVSMGDLYFAGMYPIFHPEHNGSLHGYVRNLKAVLSRISDDYKVVPGHGPLSNKAELKVYLEMIEASIATVEKGIGKGWSLEQIQKHGLDARWEPFSHGYASTDRWLALVHDSLKGTRRQ